MGIDMVAFWEGNFRRSVTDRARDVRTEADHERWARESNDWMTHIVEKEAYRLKMTDQERTALADACVRAFDEISAQVCETLSGTEVIPSG